MGHKPTYDELKKRTLELEKKFSETGLTDMAEEIAMIGHFERNWKTGEGYWSDGLYRIFGYTPYEIPCTHQSFQDLLHPEDKDRFIQIIDESVKNGKKLDNEFRIIRKDGSIRTIHGLGTTSFDKNGNAHISRGTFQDITERKEAEKKLELHSQKLEAMIEERTRELRKAQKELIRREKLAAIGRLSGSVAHDIRNPLSVINNAIYYLKLKYNENIDEDTEKHIAMVERQINRINEIMNDLTDFSRENTPNWLDGNLNSLILGHIEEIQIPENILLEIELDPELPASLFDYTQIHRVFSNLVVNAIQSMPEGGKIKISTRTKEQKIVLIIKDEGAGIPEEHYQSMFEPLFTTKKKGVGFGLSIIKTFVEKHKGAIEFKSDVGKGTTFTVLLPIDPQIQE